VRYERLETEIPESGRLHVIPRTDAVIETEIDRASWPRLCGQSNAHPLSGEDQNGSCYGFFLSHSDPGNPSGSIPKTFHSLLP
jgi:hypothetical protein